MVINNGFVKGGVALANNTGTLGSTANLIIANTSTFNRGFSGSIHNFKVYSGSTSFSQPGTNYAAQYFRYNLPQVSPATRFIRSLVVGPGGKGGNNPYVGGLPGGGGGGGVVEAYTTINIGRNRVHVGLSGAGNGTSRSSSFSDIVALGGGGGFGADAIATSGNGGSGGGGPTAGLAVLVSGSYQGFNGAGIGGAGGGAGGPAVGFYGGPGRASDITGQVTYYGGGGAGYTSEIIPPSLGGGGGSTAYLTLLGLPTLVGGWNTGMTGSANTGRGGGALYSDGRGSSNSGGSGIVIIRYQGAQQGFGGLVTSVGNDTVHTFTASGDFILL
jgi:hypothetical protein